MSRKIKIATLNEGKEFEIPERKVKHTRWVLKKTTDSPEKMEGYDTAYYTAFIVLKDVIPNLKESDIDNLTDEQLTKISNIIWETDANFPKPSQEKK